MTISRITESASCSTWEILKSLGFQDDWSVISDNGAELTFDFGNFKLSASRQLNRWFTEVIQLYGIMSSPRTIAEVQFEMHMLVESYEQAMALITWNLDKYADGHIFKPLHEASWIEKGRKYFHLLPWVQSRLAYEARPSCIVQREWLKLGFKALRGYAENVGEVAHVEIDFDGKVLSFRLGEEVVVMGAVGFPWKVRFLLPVISLKNLPKRLMNSSIDVCIWQGKLHIGKFVYSGIEENKEEKQQKSLFDTED